MPHFRLNAPSLLKSRLRSELRPISQISAASNLNAQSKLDQRSGYFFAQVNAPSLLFSRLGCLSTFAVLLLCSSFASYSTASEDPSSLRIFDLGHRRFSTCLRLPDCTLPSTTMEAYTNTGVSSSTDSRMRKRLSSTSWVPLPDTASK